MTTRAGIQALCLLAWTLALGATLSGCTKTSMALRIVRIEMSPLNVNTYVVGDDVTREALIIDPGQEVERIAEALARFDYKPKAIVATHGHIDHVSGAAEARSRFAVPFMVHAGDRAWIEDLAMQARQIGVMPCSTPVVDHWLTPNDEIAVGAHRGHVRHTPGHSEGSCSIVFDADKIVMTGDTLFRAGVGRSDLRGGSAAVLMSSIRSDLASLGDDVVFHPGHGPSGSIGQERRRLGM